MRKSCDLQVQRIADFEQQHASLLGQLPSGIQDLVKQRHKDAASVSGDENLVHKCLPVASKLSMAPHHILQFSVY